MPYKSQTGTQKHHYKLYHSYSGGGSPSLLSVAVSPVSQGGVRPFYRIVIELSKHFRYDIIVYLLNDIIESFDTISNTSYIEVIAYDRTHLTLLAVVSQVRYLPN